MSIDRNLFEEKGEPKRNRAEALLLTSLTARPKRLTKSLRVFVALRPRRREGLLGTGTSGKGRQKSDTSKQAPTRKTEAAVDRHPKNRILGQCPSGIAQRPPHHAIAVPNAMQNRVTKTLSVALPLGNN